MRNQSFGSLLLMKAINSNSKCYDIQTSNYLNVLMESKFVNLSQILNHKINKDVNHFSIEIVIK